MLTFTLSNHFVGQGENWLLINVWSIMDNINGSIDSCQNKVSADQYHLTVSRAQVSTHRGQVFFEVIRWQVTSFQMIAGSSLFFLIHMKYVVFYMCRTIKILISNWPRKLRFSQFLQAGKTCQLLLTFLTKVTRWSRSTSNFYTLIGQNLTGEFMRKIYAASWILFTLTAEADRVLCQLVIFLTVFFYWMYKNEIQLLSRVFCYSWLVCLLFFFVERCVACQSLKSDFGRHRFRFLPC